MRWRLKQAFMDFSGRSRRALVTLLLRQLDATLRGARLAREAASGKTPSQQAREEMDDIEHAGDSARGRLVHELSHVLVTPFDREDMFRLSRAIDDILDNLRDFVRELDLLAVTDPLFDPVVDELTKALDLLRDAIARIGSAPREVPDRALRAKKAGNRVRRTYQEAIAELLSGDVTVGMLRRRELLRRLDVVGLRLSDAVDTLADGAIKRTN